MVKTLKDEAIERWPLYLLVLLITGGSTTASNLTFGGKEKQESDAIEQLIDDVRELRREIRYQTHEAWTYRMERDVWDDANKQLRKLDPAWVGPDVSGAKKNNEPSFSPVN